MNNDNWVRDMLKEEGFDKTTKDIIDPFGDLPGTLDDIPPTSNC